MVKEITGIDHSAAFSYASKEDADEILFKNGGLAGLISKILGPSVPREFLEVGDVALVNIKGMKLMGIQMNGYVAVKTDNRVAHLDDKHVTKGWHI